MSNRPRPSFSSIIVTLSVIVSSGFLSGCAEDLSDDAYGFIDLAPYFYDGATPGKPTAGLPINVSPQNGWMGGLRAEYYDFGLVNVARNRAATRVPDFAVVHPMYFFFDSSGKPLFSKPVYEERTGIWHMRGGKGAPNPNPRGDAPKNVPYTIRVRDRLGDFQRPIVDRIHHDADYSGLWEVHEVMVPDDYEPDAIKSFETLERGLDSGKFLTRRTQKVINCPILDERTYVTPTPMWYGVPHPRIEIWYRTKQGSCFLADGWRTLGDDDGNLYPANSDNARLDTFDVIRYTIGDKQSARTVVVSPVGKLWVPTVTVVNQDPSRPPLDIRYVNDHLSDAMPRQSADSPPGYRPIRWMWDLLVPQDPPYEAGTYKDLAQIDTFPATVPIPPSVAPAGQQIRPRPQGPFMRNMPLIGRAVPCVNNSQCAAVKAAPGITLQCNTNPSVEIGLGVGDAAAIDNLQRVREGGPRCDVPAVRFGEFCAPGIARCDWNITGDITAGLGTDRRPAYTGPSFTHSRRRAPTSTTIPRKVTEGRPEATTATVVQDSPLALGQFGYTCHPGPVGYCYFRCDSRASGGTNSTDVDLTYDTADGRKITEKWELPVDARCGNLPGYVCVNPLATPEPPTRLRVCVRTCNPNDPETVNNAICGRAAQPDQLLATPLSINEMIQAAPVNFGSTCQAKGFSAGAACLLDPGYEPRDPRRMFVPGN